MKAAGGQHDDAVKLNDFARMWGVVAAEAHAVFERVGASGRYILGPEVRRFEARLAATAGCAAVVGVGNGLDALEICLRGLGVGPGDRVLTTPLSAFATTLAILRAGATPCFVDVDASGLLDLERARTRLRHEPRIRCLLPVHLYGHALDLEELAALRDELEVLVIEDCAQAIGARWCRRPVSAASRLAATSFYPTKNLGALGDGGAVLAAEETLAEAARTLRNYGQRDTYDHVMTGLNSRLDELHAALLADVFLPRLADWTARRRATAARYRAEIDNPALVLPPLPAGSESVWHLFPVLVEPVRREQFRSHLQLHGVQTGLHYPTVIPDQPALADGPKCEVSDDLTRARRFAAAEVSLPIHPFLDVEEVECVIRACNEWDG